MSIKYFSEVEQGSDEWYDQRRGRLTASEMKLLVTPTLKIASNEKERTHLYELLAQRITGYTEPAYINDAMLRGQEDEIYARDLYSKNYAPVTEMGFILNDKWGFEIGFSPDGLVGSDGFIEIKSRAQKFQVQTMLSNEVPAEHIMQLQTGLLVSEREWCDYVSYCGGMPMWVIRVYPDEKIQNAIIEASKAFEEKLKEAEDKYVEILKTKELVPTERRVEQEMIV